MVAPVSFVPWNDLENPIDCSICFDPNNETSVSDGSHTFHSICLSDWIQINPTCPACRRQIEEVRDQTGIIFNRALHQAPVNQAPVNQAPVNQAPVNQAPVNQAPVNQARRLWRRFVTPETVTISTCVLCILLGASVGGWAVFHFI